MGWSMNLSARADRSLAVFGMPAQTKPLRPVVAKDPGRSTSSVGLVCPLRTKHSNHFRPQRVSEL